MKNKIFLAVASFLLLFASCDDLLDRKPKDAVQEPDYWIDEGKVRLFANKFYPNFFPGYSVGYNTHYAPLRGYYFNDDVMLDGRQGLFEERVPSSLGEKVSTEDAKALEWRAGYAGPSWYFGWVRDANMMIERLDEMKANILLSDEAYDHWSGIARFFRGLEYARLIGTFGDVPFHDQTLYPGKTDKAIIFKDRDDRGVVMDKIYDDFKYAMSKVRVSDGKLNVNRYAVAAYITRWMLFEGTWQKYHIGDNVRATKYLEFAVEAGNYIMNSNKFSISGDYRSLFTSDDLSTNSEIIFYRAYSGALKVQHAVASYASTKEGQSYSANLYAIRSFICNDGKPWQTSSTVDANKFDVKSLIKTRDSRFEATFHNKATMSATTLLYSVKFCPRDAIGKGTSPWTGAENTNDAPVMRYAEVLLNWVEAKAELDALGVAPISQADLDKSINAIRNRALAPEAVAAGVVKTAPLSLAILPVDPSRDVDVPALLWEIRREHRMEFMYEHSRLLDIKRWKKLNYMDNTLYPEYKFGLWVNLQTEVPELLGAGYIGKTTVRDAGGNLIVYDGTNANQMVGHFMNHQAIDRDPFTERSYLSPIGENEVNFYDRSGFKLTQTRLWN